MNEKQEEMSITGSNNGKFQRGSLVFYFGWQSRITLENIKILPHDQFWKKNESVDESCHALSLNCLNTVTSKSYKYVYEEDMDEGTGD